MNFQECGKDKVSESLSSFKQHVLPKVTDELDFILIKTWASPFVEGR
jgi:hypothetical protein